MLRSVLLKTLRDRRRSLLGWTIGVVAFCIYLVALWPTLQRSAADLQDLLKNIPQAIKALVGGTLDYTSPEGYLSAQMFGVTMPLLFLIFAIGFGARTTAGEEQEGTLELLLSVPRTRTGILLHKLGAMVVSVIWLAAALWGTLTLGALVVGMDITAGRLAGGAVMVGLLALAFGSLALAVGSATGRRAVAISVSVVLAVAGYLVDSYASLVTSLDAIQPFSPFYYYREAEPLRNGIDPGHAIVLLLLSLVFSAIAVIAFDRRDVRV